METGYQVVVLGATGLVGQRFLQLLEDHPWFTIVCVCASARSSGKPYSQAVHWKLASPIPKAYASLTVFACSAHKVLTNFPQAKLVFSALDASVAGTVEEEFASLGFQVFSNARNHRSDKDVPIIVPMANPEHFGLLPAQQRLRGYSSGFIVTNANCSSTGLSIVLRALQQRFGLAFVFVCTMQALSGAGYPGVASLDALDNVVPFISGEEPKVESEPLKILGSLLEESIAPAPFTISAHCNRVAVVDGHTACVSVKLTSVTSVAEVEACLAEYVSPLSSLHLPSHPASPIVVHGADNRPQPRLDRDLGRGFSVSVGRVRKCPLLDFKFVLLSHNTVLGAAGSALLNAEAAATLGLIQKG